MAAYTSKATGDWSSAGQTTWNEVGVPGSGDTVAIGTGHVITVTTNTTVGTSPTMSPSGVVTVNGQLVINQGVTLTLLGTLAMSGTTGSNGVVANSGNIVLDTSVGGFNYAIAIGQQHFTTAKLVCPGTTSNRPTVSVVGTFKGRIISSGWIGGGRVEADYTDFSGLGYTGVPAITVDLYDQNFYLRDCTLTGCGEVLAGNLQATAKFVVSNTLWSGSTGTYALQVIGSTPSGGGLRTLDNCRFDKVANLYPSTGMSVTDNHFHGNVSITGYTAALWSGNLINGEHAVPNTASNDYVYYSASETNPHPVNVSQNANQSLTGFIFDLDSGTGGDLIVGGIGSGSRTALASGCLVLPNSTGMSPGELVSPLSSGYTWTVEHNTVTSTRLPAGNAETGVAVYGETWDGTPGLYASIRSNYVYSPVGKGSALLRHNTNRIADPLASPGMGDYNAFNAPITTVGSGVTAVYGASGGYCDTSDDTVMLRIVGGTTGTFTLLCYHSDGVTTAETSAIAYNALGATAATAIQTALNSLGDGTYAVASILVGGVDTRVDGSTGTTGSTFTITRNGSALSSARAWTVLRVGGTNSTGGTVNTSREMFSSTTGLGAHDIVADANFVDVTRNLATFDTAYLGNTAGRGGWADATSYAVNDIVSSTDSGFYGSAVVNFRCRAVHTSAAGNATNGKPGASATTSWRTNWELASVYRIRNSVAVYSALTRQATPRDLTEWVKAGFYATNSLLATAGHDGGVIGIGYTAAASTSVGTIFLGDDDGLAIYPAGTTIYI